VRALEPDEPRIRGQIRMAAEQNAGFRSLDVGPLSVMQILNLADTTSSTKTTRKPIVQNSILRPFAIGKDRLDRRR
jgi:hypothetical protein